MLEDDILKVLYSEEELKAKVKEIGAQITKDYAGKSVVVVGILKGAFVFMADLLREIKLDDVDIDFMVVSSYGSSTVSSGRVKMIKDVLVNIEGKDVIIVEDILDTGRTLAYLKQYLGIRKAASIKICTLLDKPERRVTDVKPDYYGYSIPDAFVVGYGLDYGEKYRNLPYVGILKPSVYSK